MREPCDGLMYHGSYATHERNAPPGKQGWRITGTRGEIIVTGFRDEFEQALSDPHRVILFSADHPEGLDCSPPIPAAGITGYPASFGYEIRDFAQCILVGSSLAKPRAADRDTPRTQAEHSLGEMKTALALYKSAETGVWETVWEEFPLATTKL
jgi:predicted dehydrogenase